MADEIPADEQEKKAVSLGSLLAKQRWAKATSEERKAVGQKLVKARRAKRRGVKR